jgi:hypothetical protein
MEWTEWKQIVSTVHGLARAMPSDRFDFTDAQIVLVYLWACYHDKPVSWACRKGHWPVFACQGLPSTSTMSRRLRLARVLELLESARVHLEGPPQGRLVHIIDGKILPVATHSQDRQATRGGPGGRQRGYRLHSLCEPGGRRVACQVHPLHVDETVVARSLLEQSGVQGYVLGDTRYHSDDLCRLGGRLGQQLLAPRRRCETGGVGHRRHSHERLRCLDMLERSPTAFSLALFARRRDIETMHAHLCGCAGGLIGLPAWVRTLPRVRLWALGKLVLDAARRRRLARRDSAG